MQSDVVHNEDWTHTSDMHLTARADTMITSSLQTRTHTVPLRAPSILSCSHHTLPSCRFCSSPTTYHRHMHSALMSAYTVCMMPVQCLCTHHVEKKCAKMPPSVRCLCVLGHAGSTVPRALMSALPYPTPEATAQSCLHHLLDLLDNLQACCCLGGCCCCITRHLNLLSLGCLSSLLPSCLLSTLPPLPWMPLALRPWVPSSLLQQPPSSCPP